MKKIIIILGVLMSVYLIINKQEELIIIPNEAIRIRIIANSNLERDIGVKESLKEVINKKVEKILKNTKSLEEAREKIKNNLKDINKIVEKKLNELNYKKDFNINYGLNYFPEKIFKGIKYSAGYYESLVVTLGDGKGKNYWCVLYPPLCLLDEEKKDDIEYRSIVMDVLSEFIA